MTEQIKGKFVFTSPKGSKVTIERVFTDKRAVEEYLITMSKIGYEKITHKTHKVDPREEGVGC